MYFAFLAQIKTPININRPTLINITHTIRKREFFHIATENSMLWLNKQVICILHILHR